MSTAESPAPRPYASAVESYWQLGWSGILPLPPHRKSPPPEGWTGWDGDWPSYADVFAWSEERPTANVGLRMPTTVLGIDVDDYGSKHGGRTLAECEAKWGPLPPTWRSSSRDDPISGIRFFTVPEGIEWPGVLPGGDVETVHFGHRYAVVAPSIHPEGRTYRWIDPDGLPSVTNPSAFDMPLLPVPWLLGLAQGNHQTQARADLDNDAAWTWIQSLAGHNAASCTFLAEWTAKGVREMGESGSRHDITRNQVLKLVRFAESGHRGIEPALDRVRSAFIRLVIGDNSRTMREASAEWGRILTGAVRIVVGNPEPSVVEGDPCGPVIATLRVPPRPTSPAPRPAEPETPKDVPPPAETPPATTEPRPTSPEVPGEVDSWSRLDLKTLLAGDTTEAPPAFLARTDGVCMLYPARVNGIIGASESAKTWLMLEGVRQAVEAERRVGYLDFESDWKGITNRLKALGLTDEQIYTYVAYLNPDRAFDTIAERMLAEMLGDHRPELVVIDGVNAAMTLNGWEPLSNKDATLFSQKILKPIARTEAAVSYVDHLPKNVTEAAGAIGAQAKRAMTTGCTIKVEVEQVFGVGQHGELKLTIDKDRAGLVRGKCADSKTIGIAHLTSSFDGSVVSIRIDPVSKVPTQGTTPALRPIMEAISRFLEPLTRPVSLNTIEKGVRGAGNEAKRDAIARLIIEGYVSQVPVGAWLYNASIRPYRADPYNSDLPPINLAGVRPGSPGEGAEGDVSRPRETPRFSGGFGARSTGGQ